MQTIPYFKMSPLSEDTFQMFRKLIYKETGINMRESKKILVSNRLRKRLLALNINSYEDYYFYLTEGKSRKNELSLFIDAVSTNETYFFRGDNQFDALQKKILPEMFNNKSKLKIWSAGCSTGEEPYTIKMVIYETAGIHWNGDIEIIATDISNEVIKKAKEGMYKGRTLRFIPPEIKKRYFVDDLNDVYRVNNKVKEGIKFQTNNLLKDDPPGSLFDIIFCRNVMIYFDKPTQKRIADEKFAHTISPEGYLFIGHSESLSGVSDKFKYQRVYRAPIYKPII